MVFDPRRPGAVILALDQNCNSGMRRLQAFKYELLLRGNQAQLIRQFAGSCRFVFNRALALQKARCNQGEKKLGYAGLCNLLTQWRNSPDTTWLATAPTHPLQQALKDLERAYANFFAGRAGPPRFKKKGQADRFRYPDPKQIKLEQSNSRVFLPKLGWVRYRNSRQVLGELAQVTVSSSGGKWFVSIQTEREVETQRHASGPIVGIDVGVRTFATCSDGISYQPQNSYRKHQKRLALLQRRLSRKRKFSSNWTKAKARVQRLHRKIANSRSDYLHKTSTEISKKHAIVVIEDLQVQNMCRSATGTIDKPGRNLKAKAALSKAILDQGWTKFCRQLEYKVSWKGGQLIRVQPQNTSRRCHQCGYVATENRKTRALFACVHCGYCEDADLNAARNILAAGHAVLACGESVLSGRSVKQESAVEAASAA